MSLHSSPGELRPACRLPQKSATTRSHNNKHRTTNTQHPDKSSSAWAQCPPSLGTYLGMYLTVTGHTPRALFSLPYYLIPPRLTQERMGPISPPKTTILSQPHTSHVITYTVPHLSRFLAFYCSSHSSKSPAETAMLVLQAYLSVQATDQSVRVPQSTGGHDVDMTATYGGDGTDGQAQRARERLCWRASWQVPLMQIR